MRRCCLFSLLVSFCCALWAQTPDDVHTFRLTAISEENIAYLHWQNLGDTVHYEVYRLLPLQEQYQLIYTTDTTEWNDTITRSVCHSSATYYVSARVGGLYYQSNAMNLLFTDMPPTTPCTIRTADVETATQRIVLCWTPSPSTDVVGYVVYKGTRGSQQGSQWLPLDTLWGLETTRYVCPPLPLDSLHAFRIAAFDTCFQESELSAACQNMVLSAHLTPCEHTLQASWTLCLNMPGEVQKYQLLMQADSTAWRCIAEVSPRQMLTATHTLSPHSKQLLLRVRAIGGEGDTVYSNHLHLTAATPSTVAALFLLAVSVQSNNALVVTGRVDTAYSAPCTLYRARDTLSWQPIASVSPMGAGALRYEDLTADPLTRYYYRWGAYDECSQTETFSLIGSPVLLSASIDAEDHIALQWTPALPSADVHYQLWRSGDSSTWQPLYYGRQTHYTDRTHEDCPGALRYRVVVHGDDLSYSNLVQVARSETLWLPNVITPLSQTNQRFCIISRYVSSQGYSLSIYHRNGQQVFHTEDPSACWDGTASGLLLPQGAYLYLLHYVDAAGRPRTLRGSVLLLH